MITPTGYLKADRRLSQAEADRIRYEWESTISSGRTVVLGQGIEFIPFEKNTNEPVIVKCSFCNGWAAVKTNCPHCGAPVGIY